MARRTVAAIALEVADRGTRRRCRGQRGPLGRAPPDSLQPELVALPGCGCRLPPRCTR